MEYAAGHEPVAAESKEVARLLEERGLPSNPDVHIGDDRMPLSDAEKETHAVGIELPVPKGFAPDFVTTPAPKKFVTTPAPKKRGRPAKQ
jgi:hypothetical protein